MASDVALKDFSPAAGHLRGFLGEISVRLIGPVELDYLSFYYSFIVLCICFYSLYPLFFCNFNFTFLFFNDM